MSAQDELSDVLKDAGLYDFMDDKAIAAFAEKLIERGIRTPSQTALLVTQWHGFRMDRNHYMLTARDLELKVRDYESAIGWNLSCTNCARLMDHNYDQYVKIEEAKTKAQELLDELQ